VEYQPHQIGLFVHGPCREGWQSLVSLKFFPNARECALGAHRELHEAGFRSYPKTVLQARIGWKELQRVLSTQ
jgi:hypothetical protein